jgi:phage tail protein X
MKHTPGPWELSEAEYKEGFGTYRRVEQVEQFGDVVGSVCMRHAVNHTLDACGDANARLIAAAPELLEALEVILRDHMAVHGVGDLEMQPALFQARAAIAKATGEQP